MKQLSVNVLTSILVIVNALANILGFVPVVFFPNPINSFLPFTPFLVSVGLMIVASLLDVIIYQFRIGSLIIILLFGFAYWIITPNILLLALFTGVIAFGQIVLKE